VTLISNSEILKALRTESFDLDVKRRLCLSAVGNHTRLYLCPNCYEYSYVWLQKLRGAAPDPTRDIIQYTTRTVLSLQNPKNSEFRTYLAPRVSEMELWNFSNNVKKSADKIWENQQDLRSCQQTLSHYATFWRRLYKIPGVALCYNLRRTWQDTWSSTLLQFDEDSTRYLQSHSVTIWWGLDKIPAVVLCYNLMRTQQDTCNCTLLQFNEDSTGYLQLYSVAIWWGIDKIPGVSLYYNLIRTRQGTCSWTLLQCNEDSTGYLQSQFVTIWWGLDKIPAVVLCCNLMRTRQDTWSITLLQFDKDSTRYLQLNSITI
jgi:hypothetical protein